MTTGRIEMLTISAVEPPGPAQSLNDALALGSGFPADISPDEVEERLVAWEKPRKERCTMIQGKERASWSS